MRTIAMMSLLLAAPVQAQVAPPAEPAKTSITTTYAVPLAGEALGKEWRADYPDAADQKNSAEGAKALMAIVSACEGYARPNLRVIAARDAAEFERALAKSGDGTPTEWLDMVCPRAAKDIAFIAIENRLDPEVALKRLTQASRWAPLWPDVHIEHGYLLGQLKRYDEALDEYRQAIALANDAGDKPVLAMAWRGIGFQLSELQKWNEARAAYRQSLDIEPGNKLATDELAWIDEQDPAGATPAP
jgi:tetratricopeptide (TPR) repeat protein